MCKIISTFYFYILLQFSYGLHLPPCITACHRNDPNLNECSLESAKFAIPVLTKGDSFYKIPKMNPLHIPYIDIPPLTNIKLTMNDVIVGGLDTSVPLSIKVNLTSQHMIFELFISVLDIIGQYKISGKLLIFPIEGEGKANLTYVGGTYIYSTHYSIITKNNIKYMQMTEHNVTFSLERAYFQFENLFNGNKLLAKQVEYFMNENWKEVNKDIGPLFAEAVDSIATSTANAVLEKVPFDEIFIP